MHGLNATLIRQRATTALIVGANGPSVLKIVSSFEGKRITTVRTDDIPGACERIPLLMPHVVLVFVPPKNDAERDALNDRVLAVGALVVHVDPRLEPEKLQQVLDDTIQTTLERKLVRDAEARAEENPGSHVVTEDDLDDGWEEG
jgi:hypothetical protein